jgi:hypothetical protein
VLLRAFENRVQPSIAAQPGEGPFDHPADAGWDEPSVPAARNRVDLDAEGLGGLGQSLAPVAEIGERRPLEVSIGKLLENRNDAFGIMQVRRRDIDRKGNTAAVLNAIESQSQAAGIGAVGATERLGLDDWGWQR